MALICWLLQLYVFVLLVRIVLSWFPLEPGGAMATVNGYLRAVTDPVLDPVRRLLPRVSWTPRTSSTTSASSHLDCS